MYAYTLVMLQFLYAWPHRSFYFIICNLTSTYIAMLHLLGSVLRPFLHTVKEDL